MNNRVEMDGLFIKTGELEIFADDEMIIGYCSDNAKTLCFNEISYLIYSMCDTKSPNQMIEHIMQLCELNKEEFEKVSNDVVEVLESFLQNHIIETCHGN